MAALEQEVARLRGTRRALMWDQVLVGAEVGDAITRNALLINEGLRPFGEADIFAEHLGQDLEGPFRPIAELPGPPQLGPTADLPHQHGLLAGLPGRRRQRLTPHRRSTTTSRRPSTSSTSPPTWPATWCAGRWELEELRDRVDLAIADSAFNAEQLRELRLPTTWR